MLCPAQRKDYERLLPHAEAHVRAFITLMSRRLARQHRRVESLPAGISATGLTDHSYRVRRKKRYRSSCPGTP